MDSTAAQILIPVAFLVLVLVAMVAARGTHQLVMRPPGWLKGVARTTADLLCMATWAVLGAVHLRRHRHAEHQVWVAWLRFRAAEQAEERPQWHLDPGDWAALHRERGHRP